MKIKEYCETWPPTVTTSLVRISAAVLAESVLIVRRAAAANNCIILDTLGPSGVTYGIPLRLPWEFLDKAIRIISEKMPMTLREVGELNI